MLKLLFLFFLILFFFQLYLGKPKNDQLSITYYEDSDESLRIFLEKKTSKYSDIIFINIQKINEYRVNVEIRPSQYTVKVPLELNLKQKNTTEDSRLYEILFDEVYKTIKIKRKSTNRIIWSTNLQSIILEDRLLKLETYSASTILFGLGEHKDTYLKKTFVDSKKYIFFNQDRMPVQDKPLYGSHPMYLNYEYNENNVDAHSLLLLNSHLIELDLYPDNKAVWTTLGGKLDFYINLGPEPETAVKQYVDLVGKPPLVPYWALGFHLCKYGYNSTEEIKKISKNTIEAGIPYDVQWSDIDYMEGYNDFSVDPVNFAGLKEFVDELHKQNRRYIPILDPGIGEGYGETYAEAIEKDILIKHADGSILKGQVWNKNLTVFPDFTNPKTQDFWTNNFYNLHKKLPFDGIWIDMNEPSNFLNGSTKKCNFVPPSYIPESLYPLDLKSICMNAKHHLGDHYELHNMFGYFESIMTRKSLETLGKRPFIISRSTFVGSGKYASHWTGDVPSTWDALQTSISNILEFNIMGIPVVGADICGFSGDTTEELCARWSTLGAFYPFSRNHADIAARDQDPVSMGKLVTEAAKKALKLRYSLLPLLYTELYKSSIDGRPVAKALSLVFPNDNNTLTIENQFLWGDSLMIIPIVEKDTTTRYVYYPSSIWYDYPSLDVIVNKKNSGTELEQTIELDDIKLAIKGGSILFIQEPKQTTYETRLGSYKIIIALDENQKATGDIYVDDGNYLIDPNNDEPKKYLYCQMIAEPNFAQIKALKGIYSPNVVDEIKIVGLKKDITEIEIDGVKKEFTKEKEGLFVIKNLQINIINSVIIEWRA